MPAKKQPSLHFNLPFQDPYTGGPNVIFHRSHRAKSGQRMYKTTKKKEIFDILKEKSEIFIQKEEKRFKNLTY